MQNQMKFSRIGGTLQLQIRCFDDLPGILELDEALWAVTAMDPGLLSFDPVFLQFLDPRKAGRIHAAEVRSAVSFLLDHLKCGDGVDQSSDVLKLADIRLDAPHGQEIYNAARLILSNLGKPGADSISASEIAADESIKACTCTNGDGIIAQCETLTPKCSDALALTLAFMGKPLTDLSGAPGADLAAMLAAEKALREYVAYRAELEKTPEILAFGADTPALYDAFNKVAAKVDQFFLASEAQAFLAALPERTEKAAFSVDTLSAAELPRSLENCPAALPNAEGLLDFDGLLNPLCADALLTFAEQPRFAEFLTDRKLSRSAWKTLQKRFRPYADWLKRLPEHAAFFAEYDEQELKQFLTEGTFAELQELAKRDLALAEVHATGTELLKLSLFQKYMLEFVNNFVSLPELFNPQRPSRLQAGKLVMDGRHFTLVMPVRDPAEHKKILQGSNICVAYVEVRKNAAAPAQLFAAAVTGGSMRTLFPGKRGIFFAADGSVSDARITELQIHPVSIAEALKSPFFRFGEFLRDQADKLFSTQSSLSQKELAAAISKAPKAPVQTPAVSGSMLLMGGGLGLAALGSSVAFIIKSLQNVSIGNVIAVLFGIVFVFGGPMVVASLVQLYRRDLGRFLESAGCAVNRRMRLSRKMGNIFSFDPPRPGILSQLADPADFFHVVPQRRTAKTICFLLLLLIVTAAGAYAGWRILNLFEKAASTQTSSVPIPTGKSTIK